MKYIDTLIKPRWIAPIAPQSDVLLTDHAIAVDKGKLLAIQPADTIKAQYRAHTSHVLDNHIVIPGLVNAHTHSPMSLFRGLADDLPLMTWLQEHIWPAEKQFIDMDFILDGTRLAIIEMLRSGTTCFNEHFFFPEVIASVAQHMGIRAVVGLIVMDPPTPWSNNADEAINKGLPLIEKAKDYDLVELSLAPHAPYTVGNDTFKKISQLALKNDLGIHVHMHETATEVSESIKQYGQRPIRRLYELGVLESRVQHVHMTAVEAEDIKLVKETQGHVVHCPQSNLKLASGLCAVQHLLESGINVALGTDGAASNNSLDLFVEMHTAALLGKIVPSDPTALSAKTVLTMATLGGASALGLSDKIGSLEVGKYADMIAVDLSHPNTQPIYNPLSHVAYAVNSRQVSDVWIQGKHLLANGVLVGINTDEILERVRQWQAKIAQASH